MVRLVTVPSSNPKRLSLPRCYSLHDPVDARHLAFEEQSARHATELQELHARHQQEQRYRLRLQGLLLHRKREEEVAALGRKSEGALADAVAAARAQRAEAAVALEQLEAALREEQEAAILARDLLCTAQSQADHFRHEYSAERRRLKASQAEAEGLRLRLQSLQLDTQRMVEALRRQCLEAIAGQKRAELRCELAASLASTRPRAARQSPPPQRPMKDRALSHDPARVRQGKAAAPAVANGGPPSSKGALSGDSATSILDLSAWTVRSDADLPPSLSLESERTLPGSGERSPATFAELEWGLPISAEQRVANEERVWQELGEEERRLEGVLQAAITRPEAGQRHHPVESTVLLALPLPPPTPGPPTPARSPTGPGLAPWLDRLARLEAELERHRSALATALARMCQVRRGRQQHMGDRVLRDEEASLTTQIAALQLKIWNGEKELASVERRFLHPIESQPLSPVGALLSADPATPPAPWALDPLD